MGAGFSQHHFPPTTLRLAAIISFTSLVLNNPTTIMKSKNTLRAFLALAGSALLAASSTHAADGTWNAEPRPIDLTNTLETP